MPVYLSTQANKAIFALQGKTKSALGYIPPALALKMFDTYILPILEYNNMLWATNKEIQILEKIQLSYLKRILGVRKQTPTIGVFAETGRFPLLIRQKISTLNYWARLAKLPDYDILNKCLKIQEILHTHGQDNYYSKVKHIIDYSEITDWSTKDPEKLVNEMRLKLYKKEQNRIINAIHDSEVNPKLRTYKIFKTNYSFETYLNLNLPKKTYSNIARFRISSHNLKIEKGRHETPKVRLEERICENFNNNYVEDEFHCLLICIANNVPRIELNKELSKYISDFNNLTPTEQFQAIMSSKEAGVINALGIFLNHVL
jgi:hypothetical protein